VAIFYGRLRRRRRERDGEDAEHRVHVSSPPPPGHVAPHPEPDSSAELLVAALLLLAALFAAGFVVVYAVFSPGSMPNQLLGACIAGSLLFLAAALVVVARRLVASEEIAEDYPREDPEAQEEIAQLVRDSAGGITRRKLLIGAASTAGGALGLAGLAPVLSLGPLWDTRPLDATPWRRGRRLVGVDGKPLRASAIEEETFYSAFAEGWDQEDISSLLVVVRLQPSALKLPRGRESWAPYGILAYSRICTHAGCAINLYRKPRFPVTEPRPALVCPCHYSTFDPADGARVIFGPAGRPLPQLPLMIDVNGYLAAAGDLSGRVGPAWWGVREQPA
jgi:ubiquinol-cytochrome c reductase iron-sulfur subunit